MKLEEINKIKNNNFKIESTKIELIKNDRTRVVEGKGYVSLTEDSFSFTIYTNTTKTDYEQLLELDFNNSDAGKIIDENEYYYLEIYEKGQIWKSNLFYPINEVFKGYGSIISGEFSNLEKKVEKESKSRSIELVYFDNIPTPSNKTTSIIKESTVKNYNYSTRNLWEFEIEKYKFYLLKEDSYIICLISIIDESIFENIDNEILYFENTIKFIFSYPFEYNILSANTNDFEITKIRKSRNKRPNKLIQPILNIRPGIKTDKIEKIFKNYYLFLRNSKYSEKIIDLVSRQVYSKYTNLYFECLSIVNTFEFLCNKVLSEYFEKEIIDKKYLSLIEQAILDLNNSSIEDSIKKRLINSCHYYKRITVNNILRKCIEIGLLTDSHKKSFENLRHKINHGENLDYQNLEKELINKNSVLMAFRMIVFFMIDYQNEFCDYSIYGWPYKNLPKINI